MTKVRKTIKDVLFYIIAFVGIIIVASLNKEGIPLQSILFGVAILILAYLTFVFVKQVKHLEYLNNKGFKYALNKVNKDFEEAQDDEQKVSMLIFKVELLNFMGNWKESLDIINGLDDKLMPLKAKQSY